MMFDFKKESIERRRRSLFLKMREINHVILQCPNHLSPPLQENCVGCGILHQKLHSKSKGYTTTSYTYNPYNKVTRSPQFSIDHLFKMKAMHYFVFCNLWTLQVGQPVDADTQIFFDFQSLLKDNGVFNQKSIIPKYFFPTEPSVRFII